ncbi:MAG: response regulator [Parcubacteria group bacterium]|jgi:DNA-binding response OmpR family regulator
MSDVSYKVLVVDDDDIIRETYLQIFKQKGFNPIGAKDGVEGLDLATKEVPDIILTGIIMPRMDGFQLITTLKENIQTKDIPIAIISHLGREEDRKRAQGMGIDNFIVQGSMTPLEIVDKLRSLISNSMTFKVSIDPYGWDAPRLAKQAGLQGLTCPNCQGKLLLELSPKKENGGFDAMLKCSNCDFTA